MNNEFTKNEIGTIYHVSQLSPIADDANPGTFDRPFKTISRAAFLAEPGDTVLIHEGIYRERVSPERGGTEEKPIVYMGVPGENVCVKGSDVWEPEWEPQDLNNGVYRAKLDPEWGGYLNPYLLGFKDYRSFVRPQDRSVLNLTRGQIFVDGEPLTQVTRMEDLEIKETWLVDCQGEYIYIHFPYSRSNSKPEDRLVEVTVRHRIFAPEHRNLGYIHVHGIRFEHASNNHPTPQIGAVSTRGGHHWIIEDCVIRYATTVGLDVGCEWGIDQTPELGDMEEVSHDGNVPGPVTGYHIIRNNVVSDNGLCGIMGLRTWGTQIVGNVVERNNRLGFRTWEWGGIKVHLFFDGLIEGNLVRDNDCFGIWIDNQYKGSRVTRNVVLNNQVAGLMVELGLGPILVDHNIIALTRQGDGIYCHDASGMTLVHNLLYGNGNYGVYVGVATDRPAVDRKAVRASNNMLKNNIIIGNRAAAISWPFPWDRATNNFSESNLYMGAGELMAYTEAPLFLYNDHHGHIPKETMAEAFQQAMEKEGMPPEDRPNLKLWKEHPFLNLELWRVFSGNDMKSGLIQLDFEMLSSRTLEFIVRLEQHLNVVPCEYIEGTDFDFMGKVLPKEGLLPGPFQYIRPGEHRFLLWPLRNKSKDAAQQEQGDFRIPQSRNMDLSGNGL